MHRLRYQLNAGGTALEYFHAAEDRQAVRDSFIALVRDWSHLRFHCAVIDKHALDPSAHDPHRFYGRLGGALLTRVLAVEPQAGGVVLVTDRLPLQRKRQQVEKTFKQTMATALAARHHMVMHHASAAHPCLQVADYLNWAIHRKRRDGDERAWLALRGLMASEFDLTQEARMLMEGKK